MHKPERRQTLRNRNTPKWQKDKFDWIDAASKANEFPHVLQLTIVVIGVVVFVVWCVELWVRAYS